MWKQGWSEKSAIQERHFRKSLAILHDKRGADRSAEPRIRRSEAGRLEYLDQCHAPPIDDADGQRQYVVMMQPGPGVGRSVPVNHVSLNNDGFNLAGTSR